MKRTIKGLLGLGGEGTEAFWPGSPPEQAPPELGFRGEKIPPTKPIPDTVFFTPPAVSQIEKTMIVSPEGEEKKNTPQAVFFKRRLEECRERERGAKEKEQFAMMGVAGGETSFGKGTFTAGLIQERLRGDDPYTIEKFKKISSLASLDSRFIDNILKKIQEGGAATMSDGDIFSFVLSPDREAVEDSELARMVLWDLIVSETESIEEKNTKIKNEDFIQGQIAALNFMSSNVREQLQNTSGQDHAVDLVITKIEETLKQYQRLLDRNEQMFREIEEAQDKLQTLEELRNTTGISQKERDDIARYELFIPEYLALGGEKQREGLTEEFEKYQEQKGTKGNTANINKDLRFKFEIARDLLADDRVDIAEYKEKLKKEGVLVYIDDWKAFYDAIVVINSYLQ
ncbi:hypothetical protein A2257_02050 [Candidatus Falkowbacteria bacterium RIFOXYA2_FULL_38_12]|uniref:Uncharacterized protein n=1 Tax=Candidatus Falkowbacteria bacterium RIFOXYA2_FULL_38_12 TaxID=1797993 RepID=A0A1F5S1Q0_9BACT|nr:MAG: hypothetical protein A2257_02050 [Candidatus Falkowbacteria bacterium RIFOXYA2_FULL_38_12]OGF42131.1 MAG: hypothetical protein A2555_04165 [Candidatus Falkowbacteria bacterium RIFOXYD2_FULL_39_16]